jgi:hypothetical protein
MQQIAAHGNYETGSSPQNTSAARRPCGDP